jgi:ribosome biogenesis GTPase
MAKRKLSRRQKWRIEKIQQERLARAERKAERDTAGMHLGPADHGRVVTHFGQQVIVENDRQERFRCHFRANLAQLVVGDRVIYQLPEDRSNDDGLGVITAMEPRHSVLERPDPYGKLKPVAANVDLMVITVAPLPAPSSILIDRYLVAAELSGIEPLLLLNKADLLDADDRDIIDELKALYRALGYAFLEASATRADGLADLRKALAGKTCVLVGQSGVGKSSIINALLPDADLEVGDISSTSGLGQHTTVTARLFHLPEGGDLIDSPGIREFGLWHISEQQLLSGYRELAELATRCRFRNCSHHQEPGCALQAAADEGLIAGERLDNFYAIAASLEEEDRRERYQAD